MIVLAPRSFMLQFSVIGIIINANFKLLCFCRRAKMVNMHPDFIPVGLGRYEIGVFLFLEGL